MKKYIILFIIIFIFSINVFAAFEYTPGNVKIKSMQYSTTALIMGIDNTVVNPASVVGVNNIDLNVSYENLFLFVHSFAGAVGYKTEYGALAAQYTELFVIGDYTTEDSIIETDSKLHTERTFRLTYGIELSDIISFGTSANLLYISQKNQGSVFNYTFDFGLIGNIYERWQLGLAILNATDNYIIGGIDQYRYYIDRTVSAGIAFLPYDNLRTSFDVSKSADYPTSIGMGLEYDIMDDLFTIRAGARSYPVEYGAGFEVKMDKFSIDYGYSATQIIGEQHHLQLNYKF